MTSVILSELWKKQQGESLISAGERVEKGFVLTKVVSMYSLFEYILWNFLAFVDTEVFPEGKPQNFSWSYEKLAITVVNLFTSSELVEAKFQEKQRHIQRNNVMWQNFLVLEMASLLVKQLDSLVLGARKCSIKQVINQVQRWLAQQAKEVWEIFVKLGFVRFC